ncbi:MAG TPA: hypothetical protein VFQ16_11965 [Burkholderiaceae bacterium]|nr:hypothetical protein [Burkholderiaceae bacterium]
MRPAVRSSRLRPSASHGGAVSSLLRLSTASRMPPAAAIDDWIGRVSRPAALDEAPSTAAGSASLVTRLWPSVDVTARG